MARFLALWAAIVTLAGAATAQTIGEARALERALAAYRAGDMAEALDEAAGAGGPGTLILRWLALRDGEGTFAEYLAFLDTYPYWPDRAGLRRRAESVLEDVGADAVLDFFETVPPVSPEGVLRHAAALQADGKEAAAEALLVKTWTTRSLSAEQFDAFVAAHGDLLAPHDEARLDAMLWRGSFDDAARLYSRVSEDWVALAEARTALRRNVGALTELIDAVPAPLDDDPGLAFERFNWRMNAGAREDAVALLLERSGSVESLGRPRFWASQRRQLARALMREGDASRAYVVASTHQLTPSDGFAWTDLEWLSGYIALTRLGGDTQALEHFRGLVSQAVTPIEKGRAHYWFARALEALGQEAAAQAEFAEAGRWQTSFYGLLAAERAGLPLDPALTGRSDANWREADWVQDPLTVAAILLEGAGERALAEMFFLALSRGMEEDDLVLLADLIGRLRAPQVAVLVGKAAAADGIVLPEIYFPLHPLARREMEVDPALALAIARRESEFDPAAQSRVGARGLMQLMPGTAREVSGWIGESYDRERLTADPDYNAALGIRYLEFLQEELGTSPVFIAAGYNAGPGRPLIWSSDFGDPRIGQADIIDWIEHIPFRETRNYVMRVTEGIPVYQARLTGQTGAVRFTELLIGSPPVIRPRARPAVPSPEDAALERQEAREPVSAVSLAASADEASDLAVGSSPRPVSRPEGDSPVNRAISLPAEPLATPGVRPRPRPGAAGDS